MNKIRIWVEPTTNNPRTDSTQNYIWRVQEFSKGRYRDGVESWRDTENWERPLVDRNFIWQAYQYFSGYCDTKEEGVRRGREAAKEYCRQRKQYEEKNEYIRTNTYVEELSCQDLK